MKNLAIYVHWPFCKSKCPYCDFNSHVADSISHKEWQEAYIKQISAFKDYISQHNISSIFFGGGTPTLMSPETVSIIINELQKISHFKNDIEITLEGNPTSVEAAKLHNFKAAGINRISLGVQSLNESDLKFLGREHTNNEAISAINTASKIFDNYSFDLIYALPGQSVKTWRKELTEALKIASKHLSLYQLTIEKGTKFFSYYQQGKFQMPDEDLAADFYLITQEIMEKAGLPAYEISNHAVPGYESKHNMSYWHYDDYLGLGPGAHSRILQNGKKSAIMMINSPAKWLDSVSKNENGIQNNTFLMQEEILEEVLIMGLRINDGIKRNRFRYFTGKDFEDVLNMPKISQLDEFIELDQEGLRIKKSGRLLLNSIIRELL